MSKELTADESHSMASKQSAKFEGEKATVTSSCKPGCVQQNLRMEERITLHKVQKHHKISVKMCNYRRRQHAFHSVISMNSGFTSGTKSNSRV